MQEVVHFVILGFHRRACAQANLTGLVSLETRAVIGYYV